jgi:hypothetical protein
VKKLNELAFERVKALRPESVLKSVISKPSLANFMGVLEEIFPE